MKQLLQFLYLYILYIYFIFYILHFIFAILYFAFSHWETALKVTANNEKLFALTINKPLSEPCFS